MFSSISFIHTKFMHPYCCNVFRVLQHFDYLTFSLLFDCSGIIFLSIFKSILQFIVNDILFFLNSFDHYSYHNFFIILLKKDLLLLFTFVSVYLYVYIYIYIYIYIFIYLYTCMYIFICVYVFIRMYVYMYVYMFAYICIYIFEYICLFVCFHLCIFCIFVCRYVYV